MAGLRTDFETTAPLVDLDFYGDAAIANPVAAYHQMLAAGPVVWLTPQSLFAVCGYDALTKVLRQPHLFSSAQGVSINAETNALIKGSTLNSDPPAHETTRAITFAPLTPKALGAVRETVQREATEVAERLTGQGRFDAAQDLAPHVPLRVVRDLLGLGAFGKQNMLDWGAATFEVMGDPKERWDDCLSRLQALRAFTDDAATLDGLSRDGWARRAIEAGLAAGMPQQQARTLMRDYIAPSLDTTISAIGYGVWLFATNPDEWTRLRKDRTLIPNAIEEIVRLTTPIRAFSRLVTEDTQLDGVALTRGTRILVVYGAANRDAARFDDPDRFDVTHNTRGHVGFGHGVHACLGMHLARLEMRLLFEALADRVAAFELAGEMVPGKNSTIHSIASLPVRVRRA